LHESWTDTTYFSRFVWSRTPHATLQSFLVHAGKEQICQVQTMISAKKSLQNYLGGKPIATR